MEPVLNFIQKMQLHPVVDHFTVSLLIVAVLIDLIASMAPTRMWIRYTALTLLILGALAAGGSFLTGDMESDRIWKALGPPAQAILKTHAQLGEYLAITFGVLALWRILIQAFAFMAGSRVIYLIVAIVAVILIGYTAHLGGDLVYDYGAGTALMAAAPAPNESASPQTGAGSTPAGAPTAAGPLPTVSVPTPLPGAASGTASMPSAVPTPPVETARPTDAPTAQPSSSPTAANL
jgi:uncharacterized membrane protein